MAHTKAGGTTKLGRDSQPKYLGVKVTHGDVAKPGTIVVRQRGQHFIAGVGARRGGDDTIYATKPGRVEFTTVRKIGFNGKKKYLKKVSIMK